MTTPAIPISQIVTDNPGVIGPGGTGLDLIGLLLTTSWRIPTGQVLSLGSQQAVADHFGPSSDEAKFATNYFLGFDNSPLKPDALLVAQYPWAAAVGPYLRGGNISGLTLAQLQAIAPGTLTIVINGQSHVSGSVNLGGATSFSNAASIIAAALGANDGSFTAAIAPSTASVTASIADDVMTVTAVGSGALVVGGTLSGSGVAASTQILSQITGTPGGIGTYRVSIRGQTVASTTVAETYGTMTVSAVANGAVYPGQAVAGAGVTAGTVVTANGTGSGGTGTYIVSPTQTVASEAMTSGAAAVSYDSVSGAFVINGGTPGIVGTIAFPTTNALATALMLTAATGAQLSQGAAQGTPLAFMGTLVQQTSGFFSFTTLFEPVDADKLAFAGWCNGAGAGGPQFAYVEWASQTGNVTANNTLGTAQIIGAGYAGTVPVYAPASTFQQAAFTMGCFASVDYQATRGRFNMAFRTQDGLTVEVSDGATAQSLLANGFNYFGAYTLPGSPNFDFAYNGSITGPFKWSDSYAFAAWFKNQCQGALVNMLLNVGQVPYTSSGYALIAETLANGPVAAGLNFGGINAGVPLSSSEVAAVNARAGLNIAPTLQNQGWFVLIEPATPQVRAARGSPPITIFYTDGGSVNKITLASLAVQ